MEDYPEELREFPQPLIALIGQASLHTSIKKFFSTRKDLQGKDVCSMNFMSLDIGANFLERKKERRISYEGYVPGGILKANWMHRQRNLIPAVAVFLLNWDADSNWKTKETEYFNDLETLRKNLKTRNTKILIALVTKQNEATYEERVLSFKKRADIENKMIFAFDKDNVQESVKKLEKTLTELTRIYYKEEGRKIKKEYNKTNLPKFTLLTLNVRHYFKVAYFAEFRRDTRSALKYYNLSYSNLKEMTINEIKQSTELKSNINNSVTSNSVVSISNANKIFEIKVVADFLIFQICKLYLFMGNSTEAINAFLRHIKMYKSTSAIGYVDLEYLHWAWVSRQYLVFGQILDNLGIGNMQTTGTNSGEKLAKQSYYHPGFYYQCAAKFAFDRKKAAIRICSPYKSNPIVAQILSDTNSNAGVDLNGVLFVSNISNQSITYIGERPSQSSSHPLDLTSVQENQNNKLSEADEIMKIHGFELKFDHSLQIIELLTKAYEQYKGPKSSRMILYIASEMASQYFAVEKFVIAKKFFDRIAKSYRKEGWWNLLSSILNTSLTCAMKLGLMNDYIEYSLELLTPEMTNSLEEKIKIQSNIIQLLKGNKPEIGKLSNTVTIPMEYNHPLFGIGIQFSKSWVYAKSSLILLIKFTSHFPANIRFSKASIIFAENEHNRQVIDSKDLADTVGDADDKNLLFIPKKPKIITFEYMSQYKSDLKCTGVELELGDGDSSIKLVWNVNEWPEFDPVLQITEGKRVFVERTSARILAHEAKVEIKVNEGKALNALVGEYYQIDVSIKNLGDPIAKGILSFELNPPLDECVVYGESFTMEKDVELNEIATDQEYKRTIYFYSPIVIRKKLFVKVAFDTAANYSSSLEKTYDISVEVPFTSQFYFFTQQFQPIAPLSGAIVINHPFFFCIDVLSTTSFPLQFLQSNLFLNSKNSEGPIAQSDGSTNILKDKSYVLQKENKITIWYQIIPNIQASGESVDLGFVQLEWKRLTDSNTVKEATKTKISIPPVKINTAPFSVKIDVPSFAVVGGITPLSINIFNHTELLQEFSLTVNENTSFLFSGDKETSFAIHPLSSHVIKHSLIPLIAGRQPLPPLQLISKRLNEELSQTKQRYIFVNPSKGESRKTNK